MNIERRHGEEGKPRLDGTEASNPLKVLGQEEEGREHRADEEQSPHQRTGALGIGEEAQRHHGVAGPHLDDDQACEKGTADRERCHRPPVAPSGVPAEHESEHDGEHSERTRPGARYVEALGVASGLRQIAGCQGDGGDADGHVDEQAPAPREPRGEDAPEHDADAAGRSADRPVQAHGPEPGGTFVESDHEEGEGGRDSNGGGGALNGPGDDQPCRRLGETAHERRQGEQGQTGDEDPPAPEDVAGPGPEQEQPPEGKHVGVLHPRQPGGREVQGLMDGGQGGDDHRSVQDRHELGGKDDRQHDRRRPHRRWEGMISVAWGTTTFPLGLESNKVEEYLR